MRSTILLLLVIIVVSDESCDGTNSAQSNQIADQFVSANSIPFGAGVGAQAQTYNAGNLGNAAWIQSSTQQSWASSSQAAISQTVNLANNLPVTPAAVCTDSTPTASTTSFTSSNTDSNGYYGQGFTGSADKKYVPLTSTWNGGSAYTSSSGSGAGVQTSQDASNAFSNSVIQLQLNQLRNQQNALSANTQYNQAQNSGTSNNVWNTGSTSNSGAAQSSWSTINSASQSSQSNQFNSQLIQNVQISPQPVIYTQPSKTITLTQTNNNQASNKQFYNSIPAQPQYVIQPTAYKISISKTSGEIPYKPTAADFSVVGPVKDEQQK